MKQRSRPDLSGAYGDSDEKLSWPTFALVILYAITIGWVCALVHMLWLWATSLQWPSQRRPPGALPRQKLRHTH